MDTTHDIEFVDAQTRGRYEARVRGTADVAFAAYERRGNTIVFTHTEVPPALGGRGVGSALARFALHDARSRRLHVVARCPFIRAFLQRHPEYASESRTPGDLESAPAAAEPEN